VYKSCEVLLSPKKYGKCPLGQRGKKRVNLKALFILAFL